MKIYPLKKKIGTKGTVPFAPHALNIQINFLSYLNP